MQSGSTDNLALKNADGDFWDLGEFEDFGHVGGFGDVGDFGDNAG